MKHKLIFLLIALFLLGLPLIYATPENNNGTYVYGTASTWDVKQHVYVEINASTISEGNQLKIYNISITSGCAATACCIFNDSQTNHLLTPVGYATITDKTCKFSTPFYINKDQKVKLAFNNSDGANDMRQDITETYPTQLNSGTGLVNTTGAGYGNVGSWTAQDTQIRCFASMWVEEATPAPPTPPDYVQFTVNASNANNESKINNFRVYVSNSSNTYIINSSDGFVNISNHSINAFDKKYNLLVEANEQGGFYNLTYEDINITDEVTFFANLSKMFWLEIANYTNFNITDNYNYTRVLSYSVNLTCPSTLATTLILQVNGTTNTSTLLSCNNATMYINGTYRHNKEFNYSIAFLLNSTYVPTNNTYQYKNRTFVSDLNNPQIEYLNFTVSSAWGVPKTNITLRCTDTVAANLTYNITFNGVVFDYQRLANNSNMTNETTIKDGYNYLEGVCWDYVSSTYSITNLSIYVRSIILIDEKYNTIFNVTNITGAKAYYDDNRTSIDFKTTNSSDTNFTILDTQKLRFEFTYADNTIITRYIDLELTDPTLRVCVNREGTTHYEQLLLAATQKGVVVKNVYSDCLVAGDYTRFAYQDSLLLKAFTIESVYYLYTYDDDNNRVYLASLDGSVSTYINVDQLEFSATAYDLSILDDAITFYREGGTVKIYYLNKAEDNTNLDLTITNMLNNEQVLNIDDFDDFNEFTIYFTYSTLANVTNATVFKLDLLYTNADGQNTLTRYFNIGAQSGILAASIAVVLGFLLSVFGLTLAATRITLSWFGALIMLASIGLLSFAVSTWYIIFLMVLDAIVLIYIILTAAIKNYSTLT